MSNGRNVWQIQLGVFATEEQADQLKEQILRLLCPDPDHAPPCPVPWTVSMFPVTEPEDLAGYSDLLQQAAIETPAGERTEPGP